MAAYTERTAKPPDGAPMPTLTLRLDPDLDRDLAALAQHEHLSKSAMVRELLRRQMILQRFSRSRAALKRRAEAIDVLTDEDVFARIG